MKHEHQFYPYEYLAHYEIPPVKEGESLCKEKLHCTYLATLICGCGEVKPIAPKPLEPVDSQLE